MQHCADDHCTPGAAHVAKGKSVFIEAEFAAAEDAERRAVALIVSVGVKTGALLLLRSTKTPCVDEASRAGEADVWVCQRANSLRQAGQTAVTALGRLPEAPPPVVFSSDAAAVHRHERGLGVGRFSEKMEASCPSGAELVRRSADGSVRVRILIGHSHQLLEGHTRLTRDPALPSYACDALRATGGDEERSYEHYVDGHADRARAAAPNDIPPPVPFGEFRRALRAVVAERDSRGSLSPYTLMIMRLSRTDPELFDEIVVVSPPCEFDVGVVPWCGEEPTSMGLCPRRGRAPTPVVNTPRRQPFPRPWDASVGRHPWLSLAAPHRSLLSCAPPA